MLRLLLDLQLQNMHAISKGSNQQQPLALWNQPYLFKHWLPQLDGQSSITNARNLH